MDKKQYVIVKDRGPFISEILNDCVNLCVPARRGESLASILQKICGKIQDNNLKFYNTDSISFDRDGNEIRAHYIGGPIDSGTQYTNEQAQDAVGYILSSEFIYSDGVPQISIGQIEWSKIVNAPNFAGVTSISVSGLSPLFTTGVVNPTTTAGVTFSLINAPANSYFGNNTGSSAPPAYNTAGALTTVPEENISLSLSSNAATSLFKPVSITPVWTGTLSLAKGGLGTSLTAPLEDKILFYDASSGISKWLTIGSGLQITDTTITATAMPVEQLPKRIAHFIVGIGGYMSPNTTTYTSISFAGLSVDQVQVYVDGLLLFNGLSDRISFGLSGITMSFTNPLPVGTAVQVFQVPPAQDGTATNPVEPVIYYGAKSSGSVPTLIEISAGLVNTTSGAGTVTLDWQPFNASFQYLWFAIPNLAPSYNKTSWYSNPLNNGGIGGTSNLFGSPTNITIGGQVYRVWITNYVTKFFETTQLS